MNGVKNDIFGKNGAVVVNGDVETWFGRADDGAVAINMKDTAALVNYVGRSDGARGYGVGHGFFVWDSAERRE